MNALVKYLPIAAALLPLAAPLQAQEDGNWYVRQETSIQTGIVLGVLQSFRFLPQLELVARQWEAGDSVDGIDVGMIDELYDGAVADGTLSAASVLVGEVMACHADKPWMQAIAIVDDYIQDHPAVWHAPLPELALMALMEACPELR